MRLPSERLPTPTHPGDHEHTHLAEAAALWGFVAWIQGQEISPEVYDEATRFENWAEKHKDRIT